MELMAVIRDREHREHQANTEARRVAEGGRANETTLQRLAQRVTRKAKGI